MDNYGKKSLGGERLVWWKQAASEAYWYEHFKRQIDSQYQTLTDGKNPAVVPLIKPYLPKSGRILEAGCGSGWIVHALKQSGYNVEGVDYSEKLIELVHQQYPELSVRVGDVCALDVPDAYYSAYVSFGVIEHRFEGSEPFLKEAWRVVESGGVLAISVPFFNLLRKSKARLGFYSNENDGLDFYQYGFTKKAFRKMLTDAGFEFLGFRYYGTTRCLQEEFTPYTNQFLKLRGAWRLHRYIDFFDYFGYASHMILAFLRKP